MRCSPRGATSTAAIVRFRAALAATPDYPDALNNLGYALLLTGHDAEARALYEKALALQPDFPEALNNLGLLLGRAGDMERAERYFREALSRRADYGEAANNLALVLVSRGQADAAVSLLDEFPEADSRRTSRRTSRSPRSTTASAASEEAVAVLERLVQQKSEKCGRAGTPQSVEENMIRLTFGYRPILTHLDSA